MVGKLVWILSSFINRACLFTVCFGALKIEIRSESARLSFSLSTFGLPHPIDIYFLYIRAISRGKKRFLSVQLQTALPTIYVCQTGKRGTAALDWRCENMQKFAVTAKLKVEMLSPAVFTLLPTLNFSFSRVFSSIFFSFDSSTRPLQLETRHLNGAFFFFVTRNVFGPIFIRLGGQLFRI